MFVFVNSMSSLTPRFRRGDDGQIYMHLNPFGVLVMSDQEVANMRAAMDAIPPHVPRDSILHPKMSPPRSIPNNRDDFTKDGDSSGA